jgi:hypothetical protein
LDKTSGLLLSDFDPFDSLGTEQRFMAQLSLLGEFRVVEGPTYFKKWHGENLSIKRGEGWSREHWLTAIACWAAWMIEVIAPAGGSAKERRRLVKITLDRFAGGHDPLKWIRSVLRNESKVLLPLRMIGHQLKRSEKLTAAVQAHDPVFNFYMSIEERSAWLRQVFKRLKSGGRFDPHDCLNMSWAALETEILSQKLRKR